MAVKIGIIWGNHRNDLLYHTHHSFWEAALQDRKDVHLSRYTWGEFPDMPKTLDLYLFVDFHPSLFKLSRMSFRNTAYYWWDSYHLSQAIALPVSELFDRSYFAEHVSAVQARQYGFPVQWLPPAFYPGVFRPLPLRPKVHDYAFVGQMNDVVERSGDTKRSFMEKLARAKDLHGYMGAGTYGDRVNDIYNDARVLFERTIFSTVGTRFFELLGSGGFCLMNRLRPPSGIEHLAIDGIHYASYDDTYLDFERKLRYYLSRPEEMEALARAGHAHVLQHHTYARRLEKILSDFGLVQ